MPQPADDPLVEEDNDDDDDLLVEEEASEQLQASTSTPSTTLKHKIPATEKPSAKEAGICSLTDAEPYYPSVSDKERYLHCGVDGRFISDRISSHTSKAAGYSCKYSDVCKEEGKIVSPCEWFSTTKAQLSTHLRQAHLGIAVTCFICCKWWWAASTWFKHMKTAHSALAFDNFFLREGAEAELEKQTLLIKQEVTPEDI